MIARRWIALGSAAFLLSALHPACAGGGDVKLGAWVTYWDHDRGMGTVRDRPGAISDVMLFAVHLDPDGNPVRARPEWDLGEAVATIREAGGVPWLTVVNDVVGGDGRKLKDADVLHRILEDPAVRRKHINQIVEMALELGVSGVDVDYENLDPVDRDGFSALVSELSVSLKSQRLLLSVTVQPKRAESRSRGPGAADWKALCAAADRLQIMMYNLHNARTEPGPVATSDWIDEVLDYALTVCDAEQIVPVLKLGGYDWGASGARDATFQTATSLLDSGEARRHQDRKRHSPYITYEADGESRITYYEDAESLRRKLRRISKRGLRRVIVWSLGRQDPAIFPAVGGR